MGISICRYNDLGSCTADETLREALRVSEYTTTSGRRSGTSGGSKETEELIAKVIESVQKDRNFMRKVFETAPTTQ